MNKTPQKIKVAGVIYEKLPEKIRVNGKVYKLAAYDAKAEWKKLDPKEKAYFEEIASRLSKVTKIKVPPFQVWNDLGGGGGDEPWMTACDKLFAILDKKNPGMGIAGANGQPIGLNIILFALGMLKTKSFKFKPLFSISPLAEKPDKGSGL